MDYIEFLKEELKPAFGCTEPIALAYAAAKAKEVLGETPKKIIAYVSGNIVKNANSVKVPGTNGRKGLAISIVAGAFLGDASKYLEVLVGIDKEKLTLCDKLIQEGILEIQIKPDVDNLYIDITIEGEKNTSRVVIEDAHTNIVLIEKNKKVLYQDAKEEKKVRKLDLSFDKIYHFALEGDYSEIKAILDRQMEYNLTIAEEGIQNSWGSNIGSIILKKYAQNYDEKLIAYAAAGSDARMSGCELPVVINSGSGNQGITVAVPVVVYAKDHHITGDKLYRAMVFANLIGLYIKEGIGKLSAYCGVVSAGAASVCGIAFLKGESKEIIEETLSNALVTNSGIICDGAKSSCASKIASSLRNAFLSYEQAKSHNSFEAGDGIVKEDVEKTIDVVGHIAKYGMKKTDEVILSEILNKRDYLKDVR